MSNILKQLRGDSVLPVWPKFRALGTPIEILFAHGGPTAILRRVRAVLVAAINGMGWCGLVAHVPKEAGEIMDPFITDGDPSTAIVVERLIERIVAPHLHGNPCRVFGRVNALAEATALAVFCERGMNAFKPETSTRNDKSLRQMPSANVNLPTAVAYTKPVSISPARWEFRHRNQSSEPNTSVIAFTHDTHYSAMVLVS